MKRLPKILLRIAVTALAAGFVVNLSGIWFAPGWTVVLPFGVIALGLFVISWFLQDEVARFDEEHRSKPDSAGAAIIARNQTPEESRLAPDATEEIHEDELEPHEHGYESSVYSRDTEDRDAHEHAQPQFAERDSPDPYWRWGINE